MNRVAITDTFFMRSAKLLIAAAALLCVLAVAAVAIPPEAGCFRIDLGKYTGSAVGVEFSSDGQFICTWWWPNPPIGDQAKLPLEFAIFRMDGQLVSQSSSSTNRYKALVAFPIFRWRESQQEFVKDAVGWAFSRDFAQGLRIRVTEPGDRVAEMWTLPVEGKPLWVTHLEGGYRPMPLKCILDSGDKTIVIALTGKQAVVLDRATGQIQSRFSFGHIESDEEARMRKRRFGLGYDDGDPALAFNASKPAENTQKGWVACGAFFDKRVRVVEIGSGKIVFEANTDVNPRQRWVGGWSVERVAFFADAKYLMACYDFGGRGTSTRNTEIYETATWKVVWEAKNSATSDAVTLSPDGTKIAFIRQNVLEVRPFNSSIVTSNKTFVIERGGKR